MWQIVRQRFGLVLAFFASLLTILLFTVSGEARAQKPSLAGTEVTKPAGKTAKPATKKAVGAKQVVRRRYRRSGTRRRYYKPRSTVATVPKSAKAKAPLPRLVKPVASRIPVTNTKAVRTAAKPAMAKPAVAVSKTVTPKRAVRYRSRQRRYYTRRSGRKATTPAAVPVFDKTGNLVEPLSNGLTFTMARPAVEARYGKAQSMVGNQMRYADFGVEYAPGKSAMRFVALQHDVRLNCKLGTGATRQQVEKLFGKLDNKGEVIYKKKYRMLFSRGADGRVDAVTITPASGYAAL